MNNQINITLTSFETSKNIDELTSISLKVFEETIELGFYPIYNKANSKQKIKLFENSLESVKNELEDNWDKQFPELGTRISKFYSITNDYDNVNTSGSISISIASEKEFAPNVINISVYEDYNLSDNLENILNTFKSLITLQDIKYAYIESIRNYDITNSSRDNRQTKMPRTVQWLNYWDNEIIYKIGVENINNAGFYKIEKLDNGYLLILQEKPINNDSEDEIANQKNIINHLSKFW